MPWVEPSCALCELRLSVVVPTPDILILGYGLCERLLGLVDFVLAGAHALSVLILLDRHFELWLHVGIEIPFAKVGAATFAKKICLNVLAIDS
jgi:hypothetical protein